MAHGEAWIEQDIGSKRNVDPMLLGKFKGPDGAFAHGDLLRPGLWIGEWDRVFIVEKGLQAPHRARLGHQLGGFVVREMSMLDTAHPGRDRTAGSPERYRHAP